MKNSVNTRAKHGSVQDTAINGSNNADNKQISNADNKQTSRDCSWTRGCPTLIAGRTAVLSMGAVPGSAAGSLGPVLRPARRCSPRTALNSRKPKRRGRRWPFPQREPFAFTSRGGEPPASELKCRRSRHRVTLSAREATAGPWRGCRCRSPRSLGEPRGKRSARCGAARLRRPLPGSRPPAGPRGRRDGGSGPAVCLSVRLRLCLSVCIYTALRGAVRSAAASLPSWAPRPSHPFFPKSENRTIANPIPNQYN